MVSSKMTRRTKPKKAEPIKAVAPEPETFLCEEPKCAPIKNERENCSEPCIFQAYRNGLCFNHFKESQGFVFDSTKKIFVKKKEK